MSRIPSHLRNIKIKELRELQKRGMSREKQLVTDVLGTRLLASVHRPTLKRYALYLRASNSRKPSQDEASDVDGHTGTWRSDDSLMIDKRVFSGSSDTNRSPTKTAPGLLPRVKGRTLQSNRTGQNITRGASGNSKRGKK